MDASAGDTGSAPTLESISEIVAEDLTAVDQLLVRKLQDRVKLIPELAEHIVRAGGKRIRPLVTILAARAAGHTGKRHIRLAAAIEFIHSATLLHDDVVDKGTLRRGRQAANEIWGNSASVLVGDFLFSQAFCLMVEDPSRDVLRLLSGTSAEIARGEVFQLSMTGNTRTTEEEHRIMVESKTAQLFAAAAGTGGLVAKRPEKIVDALRNYGRLLGTAFQLIDDALDYGSDDGETGKATGGDFREGRMTLPVILAYARGDEEERAFWDRTLGKHEQKPKDFAEARRILASRNTIDATRARAAAAGEEARACLSALEPSPYREALDDLVGIAVVRTR